MSSGVRVARHEAQSRTEPERGRMLLGVVAGVVRGVDRGVLASTSSSWAFSFSKRISSAMAWSLLT